MEIAAEDPSESILDEVQGRTVLNVDDLNLVENGAGSHQSDDLPGTKTPELQNLDNKNLSLGKILDLVSILSCLAAFGIIGVLVRYGLNLIYSPQISSVTEDYSALFLDIPSNMFGCFVMGWVGVVMKKKISFVSEPLALGLSTGLCGSITTFASWNQRLLATLGAGLWLSSLSGYVFGAQLSIMSLIVGIDTAEYCLLAIEKIQLKRELSNRKRISFPSPDNLNRRWLVLITSFSLTSLFLILAGIGLSIDSCLQTQELWLSLLLAPFGVWVRWYLSSYNGKGIGSKNRLAWMPLGTLTTNIVASMLESTCAILGLVGDTRSVFLVTGACQIGLLGAMSTVSTFVVEVKSIWEKGKEEKWRAYAYCFASLGVSFLLGVFIYCLPVWINPAVTSRYVRIDAC